MSRVPWNFGRGPVIMGGDDEHSDVVSDDHDDAMVGRPHAHLDEGSGEMIGQHGGQDGLRKHQSTRGHGEAIASCPLWTRCHRLCHRNSVIDPHPMQPLHNSGPSDVHRTVNTSADGTFARRGLGVRVPPSPPARTLPRHVRTPRKSADRQQPARRTPRGPSGRRSPGRRGCTGEGWC